MWATIADKTKRAVPVDDSDIVYAKPFTTSLPTIIPTLEPTAVPTSIPTEAPLINMGTFKLTFYCPCSLCCGKSDGITATGTQATEGRTVAADPSVLPYGSKIVINGHEYIVEDCGVRGNTIDVFMNSHQQALENGVQYATVYLRKE